MQPTVCKIDGCARPAVSKGFCKSHYLRAWKYGDPLAGKELRRGTRRGDPMHFITEVAVNYSGNDCLLWPFAKTGNGYGHLAVSGRKVKAHRYVCSLVNGDAPTASHQCAHSCGNGHLGCVNPNHLSWKTRLENKADELVHGTRNSGERNGSSKITEQDAREILRLKGSASLAEIAAKFGIAAQTVSQIHNRSRWTCLWADRPTPPEQTQAGC